MDIFEVSDTEMNEIIRQSLNLRYGKPKQVTKNFSLSMFPL